MTLRAASSGPPGRSPRTPCAPRPPASRSRRADRDRPRGDPAVADGSADRALVPFENAIEGSVRPPSTRSRSRRAAASRSRVTSASPPCAHCPHGGRCRCDQDRGRVSPTEHGAWFLREELPRAERIAESTAEAVRTVGASERPWAALGAASAAEIYGCWCSATASRTSTATSRGSCGSRPTGSAPRATATWRDADLLRAGCGPPGRAGRGADRVLRPPGEPRPDRVAAPPARPRPLHVLHRPRRRRHRPGRRRGDRSAAGKAEAFGYSAATRFHLTASP